MRLWSTTSWYPEMVVHPPIKPSHAVAEGHEVGPFLLWPPVCLPACVRWLHASRLAAGRSCGHDRYGSWYVMSCHAQSQAAAGNGGGTGGAQAIGACAVHHSVCSTPLLSTQRSARHRTARHGGWQCACCSLCALPHTTLWVSPPVCLGRRSAAAAAAAGGGCAAVGGVGWVDRVGCREGSAGGGAIWDAHRS